MSKETDNPEQEPKSLLQTLIDAAGLTQKQVADALGVSSQTVNNWLRGRYTKEGVKLSIRQVKTLCRLLNCSLDQLPDDFGIPDSHSHHSDFDSNN